MALLAVGILRGGLEMVTPLFAGCLLVNIIHVLTFRQIYISAPSILFLL